MQKLNKVAPSHAAHVTVLLLLVCVLTGCTTQRETRNYRPFSFETDTLSFPNELVWQYGFDANGKWTASRREPEPTYAQHCFVVARCARQFFYNAKFDPTQPKMDKETYSKLIEKVVHRNPRMATPDSEKVVIPGYAHLRAFSKDHEALLKDCCGGAWQSYLQRGNWRMVFPFSRRNQEQTASSLQKRINANHAPVVHITEFPKLSINHAVLLFDVEEAADELTFAVYDPNNPESPTHLTFKKETRTFHFPRNNYFAGGKVNVYEVYKSALY